MSLPIESQSHFRMVGGYLCLDFTNTVGGWREIGEVDDHLTSFQDLVSWSQSANALTAAEARALLQQSAEHPARARAAFKSAIALREAIYRIFAAIAAARDPEAKDCATLNASLSRAMAHARIVMDPSGFHWDWGSRVEELDRMVWPIARSAADLLTSKDLRRVASCAGDNCGWLFLDSTRNHSRRWCDMSDCGNRAKARRHYARIRKQPRDHKARRSGIG